MKNEKWLSRTLRAKCSIEGQLTFWSFEFAGGLGTPDIYCVARDSSGWQSLAMWLELKVVSSDRQHIPFRPGQVKWMTEHRKAGGRLLVLVFDNETQTLWLVPDSLVSQSSEKLPLRKFADIPGVTSVSQLGQESFWPRVCQALRERA